MSGYPLFFGEPGEDAELFLANFKMSCRIKRIVTDQERVEMFEVVLRKDASTWFDSLPEEVKGNYTEVLNRFKRYFFDPQNTQKLWQDIVSHKQKDLDDYYLYKQEFLRLWALWIRNVANPGDGAEFLKKERFIAGLFPDLKVKVEVGAPATFDAAQTRAAEKYRKLKCLRGEVPIEDLRPKGKSQASTSRELPEVTAEVIEKLNESLSSLSIHLAQAVDPKGQAKKSEERDSQLRRVLQCWNWVSLDMGCIIVLGVVGSQGDLT
ncbi:hypothetical protein [Enterobacter cloacae complex sp. GF14B]|uniref:hypothetical protein n=1 Tax=Enterobacter cloacae complex sp. GF14B TaxID=2511982 RepID=UPI00100FF0AF|nr:hypothetical protein [Enterobacter cloacae complex sp. GF14B]